MLEFADLSTPLDRRRDLRGARSFRLAVEGEDGESTDYFVRAPTGVAAPVMRGPEAVSFGLYAAD